MKLEDMEKICEKATQGPWYHVNIENEWCDEIYNEPTVTNLENGIATMYGKGTPKSVANTEFICTARDWVPWAIEQIRVLEEDRRVLEDKVHMLLMGKQ